MTNRDEQTTPATQEPHNRLCGKVGPLAGLTAQVKYYDGVANGFRRADALGSLLLVDAGPVAKFPQIAATGAFRNKIVVYDLEGIDTSYVGRGDSETRLPSQVCQIAFARQFYVVHTRDARIGAAVAKHLEARLMTTAFACGSRLTNKVAAVAPDCTDDGIDFERAFQESLLFLAAANCSTFGRPCGASAASTSEEGFHFNDGYQLLEDFDPPEGAQLLRLDHRNLVCEAYAVGDNLVVKPGSHFVNRDGPGGLHQANIRRRDALLKRDIFEADAARSDRKRLNHWVAFERPGVAARILSGSHSPLLYWVPAPAPRNVVDILPAINVAGGIGRSK
jgi:hypothetical protein